MKNWTGIISLCLGSIAVACGTKNQENRTDGLHVIRIEEAMQNQTDLALSDLGKTYAYVPLETTDSSIITISSVTAMAVTDRLILVGAQHIPLKAFDKKTGRYIGQLGGIGNGPTEYPSGRRFQPDPVTGNIYVQIAPNRYQCYDPQGGYVGPVAWEEAAQGMVVTPYFLADRLYSYVNVPTERTSALAYMYELPSGEKRDSLPVRWGSDIPEGKFKTVLPLVGSEIIGGMALFVQFQNDKWTYGCRFQPPYWYQDDELRLKDFYCDTIFAVKGFDRLEPRAVFEMGKLGGFDRFENSEAMAGKFIVTRVLETDNVIYFNLIKDMYDIDGWLKGRLHPTYCGIYDKASGTTKIMKQAPIPDDLAGLPGFTIYNISTDGELIVCYQTEDLIEAREHMPESQQPDWLKQLKEDDNPVLLLIR